MADVLLTELDFHSAIEEMTKGKRLTRKEWKDVRTYCLLKDRMLQIHKKGEAEETTHPWIINDGDLEGLDWYTI